MTLPLERVRRQIVFASSVSTVKRFPVNTHTVNVQFSHAVEELIPIAALR